VQWSRGTKGEGGVRRRNRVVFEFIKIFRCNDGGRPKARDEPVAIEFRLPEGK